MLLLPMAMALSRLLQLAEFLQLMFRYSRLVGLGQNQLVQNLFMSFVSVAEVEPDQAEEAHLCQLLVAEVVLLEEDTHNERLMLLFWERPNQLRLALAALAECLLRAMTQMDRVVPLAAYRRLEHGFLLLAEAMELLELTLAELPGVRHLNAP
jgi:hypothetical protein